jgi:phosphonoacetate hydrolase
MTTYLVICIDGCSPDYLQYADTPTLDTLAVDGFYKEVRAMVPTVTNVNNVSIVTGAYPAQHGITSNYYRSQKAGQAVYMETADFLLCETVFERVEHAGQRSALLTVKDKLRTLLDTGAPVSISAEKPPAWLVARLGPPPNIYSLEVNYWLMAALRELMREENAPKFVYLATTDYAMHKFAPKSDEAIWHLSKLDQLLGETLNSIRGDVTIAVTADHGMEAKARAVDLTRVLAGSNIPAEVVPIIKDHYVAHHQNMGGAVYIYLENRHHLLETIAVLETWPGVEKVLTAEEAATRFHLHPSRIGDLLVLAKADTVLGTLETTEERVDLRSHGSLHEQLVPLIGYGGASRTDWIAENKDAMVWIEEKWTTALRTGG